MMYVSGFYPSNKYIGHYNILSVSIHLEAILFSRIAAMSYTRVVQISLWCRMELLTSKRGAAKVGGVRVTASLVIATGKLSVPSSLCLKCLVSRTLCIQ